LSGTRLALSPSWKLAVAIVALHAAAAVSLLLVLPGASGMALAALLVLLGFAAAWARGLLASAKSVRALELADELTVELKDGSRFPAALSERRHVSRYMVTLPMVRPSRRTVLVSRDMLGAEEFRRLRLWALWGKLPRVAPEQLHFRA
jgi:hypothetical protein